MRASGSWCPGRSWAAWARALGHLLPAVARRRSRLRRRLPDHRSQPLGVARHRHRSIAAGARAGARRSPRAAACATSPGGRGRSSALPLGDASVDVAILSQALHHAADPAVAVAEAARIVVPGGRVLVLDLREHDAGVGRPSGSAIAGGASPTRRSTKLLKQAGLTDVKVVGRRAPGRRSFHRPHCQRPSSLPTQATIQMNTQIEHRYPSPPAFATAPSTCCATASSCSTAPWAR